MIPSLRWYLLVLLLCSLAPAARGLDLVWRFDLLQSIAPLVDQGPCDVTQRTISNSSSTVILPQREELQFLYHGSLHSGVVCPRNFDWLFCRSTRVLKRCLCLQGVTFRSFRQLRTVRLQLALHRMLAPDRCRLPQYLHSAPMLLALAGPAYGTATCSPCRTADSCFRAQPRSRCVCRMRAGGSGSQLSSLCRFVARACCCCWV
jgi:hypothetical protein